MRELKSISSWKSFFSVIFFSAFSSFLLSSLPCHGEIVLNEDFSSWNIESLDIGRWQMPLPFEGLRKVPEWPNGDELVLDASQVDVETTSHPSLRYFLTKEIQIPSQAKSLEIVAEFQWGHYTSPMFFVGRYDGASFSGFGFALFRDGSDKFTHAEVLQLDNAPLGTPDPVSANALHVTLLHSQQQLSGKTLAPVESGQIVKVPNRDWIQCILMVEHLGGTNWKLRLTSDSSDGPSIEVTVDDHNIASLGELNSAAISVKAQGGQLMQIRNLLIESD